ncbi:DNA-binding IclR family transcriptional regulator [Mycobacterium frederiksbergense]|uniref:DNA-binding IclR family transcriptional regulator n=1 Tax=Mycolicibacterium frederiksbergense TaxID=117567 RepID=A0ABT6KZA7_9MYCO|nr:IclR family transcriptional regulator [Mycolicibacterium frederiksbergense]MDH6196032.1 DNA-binding IclR family transcriptional regulator [Mycolicibacterium frederiksbergense]
MQRSATDSTSETATSMVARVALIMNSFNEPGKSLRLDQVVTRTGLPRSSVHRILTQLHAASLLHRRPDGYCLAASTLPVTRADDHSQLRGVASRVLDRLHADTALAVHLGVLLGADVVYLDNVSGGSAAVLPTRVAGRTPAHASALGKAMLALLPAEEVDAIVAEPLRKCTPATIADLPTLHQELARIRSRHGLAYDDQELVVGLSSVAAPIRMTDGRLAGLSLSGAVPIHRLQRMAPFLTRAARGISQHIGSTGVTPAHNHADPVAVTDDMLSRVLRTLSSDDWV